MNAANSPNIWQSFQVENLCESVKTINLRSKGEGFFKYVDISAIDNKNKVIVAAREISNLEAPSRARQVIKTNDVLVSTVRPGLNAVAIVPEVLDGQICSTGFCVLRAKPELLDPEFLFYWVQHYNFVDALTRLQRGISYPAVRDSDIKKLNIFLPQLPEQKQIVILLKEVNELRWLRLQANEKLEVLFKAWFFYYFGTGKPSKDFPEQKKLKELLEIPLASGFSPNTNNEPPGIPVFGLSAITDYGLDPKKVKYYPVTSYRGKGSDLRTNDILITRSNTQKLVGKVSRYRGEPSPVIYPDLMIRIRLKDPKDSFYIESFFRSAYMTDVIQRLARGTSASMKKISQKDIDNFDILYPPREIRYEYAEQVRELEQLYKYYSSSFEKLDDLVQSLLAQAFTGELTTRWREQHQKELATAAAERNRLFQISQSADVGEPTSEEAIEVRISEQHRDRTELLNNLSQEQRRFYELIIQESAYFTPEGLEEKYNLPRNQIQGSLQLFAATGLILPLSLPTAVTKGLRYELAYRNLNPDDDTWLSDGILGGDRELEKERV